MVFHDYAVFILIHDCSNALIARLPGCSPCLRLFIVSGSLPLLRLPSFNLHNNSPALKEFTAMLTTEHVRALIADIVPCEHLVVEGDGHHFFAEIVSHAFEGKNRLARHRLIKDGLSVQLASNELHALSISVAATPAEWTARQAA